MIKIPPVSDHGSEIALLSLIAVGVIVILIIVALRGLTWDIAACLLVLQGIISAIKERWTQRSVDRMGQNLADSAPPAAPGPAGTVDDPVNVVEPKP